MKPRVSRALGWILVAVPLASSGAAQMDVEEISIIAYASRFDGALDPLPYGFGISVAGTEIAAVSVQTPNGALLVLVQDDEGWSFYKENAHASFSGLSTDLDFGFGSFVFSFTGDDASTDSVTVVYAPSSSVTAPHSGFGNVTFPDHDQDDVTL